MLDNIFIKPRIHSLSSRNIELPSKANKGNESYLTFYGIPILPKSKNKELIIKPTTNEFLPNGESYLVKVDDAQALLNIEKYFNIDQLLRINVLNNFLRLNDIAYMSFFPNQPKYRFLHPLDNYAIFCCRLLSAITGSPKNGELVSTVYTEKQFIMYYVLTKDQKPPLLYIKQYDTDSYYTIIITPNIGIEPSDANNLNSYREFTNSIIFYSSFAEIDSNENLLN